MHRLDPYADQNQMFKPITVKSILTQRILFNSIIGIGSRVRINPDLSTYELLFCILYSLLYYTDEERPSNIIPLVRCVVFMMCYWRNPTPGFFHDKIKCFSAN